MFKYLLLVIILTCIGVKDIIVLIAILVTAVLAGLIGPLAYLTTWRNRIKSGDFPQQFTKLNKL